MSEEIMELCIPEEERRAFLLENGEDPDVSRVKLVLR
jgi:hypothetical protein